MTDHKNQASKYVKICKNCRHLSKNDNAKFCELCGNIVHNLIPLDNILNRTVNYSFYIYDSFTQPIQITASCLKNITIKTALSVNMDDSIDIKISNQIGIIVRSINDTDTVLSVLKLICNSGIFNPICRKILYAQSSKDIWEEKSPETDIISVRLINDQLDEFPEYGNSSDKLYYAKYAGWESQYCQLANQTNLGTRVFPNNGYPSYAYIRNETEKLDQLGDELGIRRNRTESRFKGREFQGLIMPIPPKYIRGLIPKRSNKLSNEDTILQNLLHNIIDDFYYSKKTNILYTFDTLMKTFDEEGRSMEGIMLDNCCSKMKVFRINIFMIDTSVKQLSHL